jgi:hypothetical protein
MGTLAAQVQQLLYPMTLEGWIIPRPPGMQPFGNLAQRNHAACVHALSLLSLAYAASVSWRYRGIARGLLLVAAGASLMGLAMTGSRIGTILGALAALGAARLAVPGFAWRRHFIWVVVFVAGYGMAYAVASSWLFSLPTMTDAHGAGTRWATYGTGTRVALLFQSWDMFASNPLIGSGWLSYSLESLRRVETLSHPQFAGNAHNLVAHLAAETGLLGLVIVLVPLGLVGWHALRRPRPFSAEVVFLIVMIVAFLVYSMTEFPLWFTFFLLPFMFALGALERPVAAIPLSRSMRALLVALCIAMASGAWWAMERFGMIARLVGSVYSMGHIKPEIRAAAVKYLDSPGFAEQTEFLAFGLLSVDVEDIEKKVALGERVVAYHIDAFMLQKQASLLALAGNHERGADYLVAACRFYPERCRFTMNSIKRIAAMDPTVFDPLVRRFQEKAAADPRFPHDQLAR